jgi:hypothetical protein
MIRNSFAICFAVLLVASLGLWIVGILTAAVLPWFGGATAERVGEIGFTVALVGEGVVYLFAWLWSLVSRKGTKYSIGKR